MTLTKFNRALYLMYHFNNRNITSPEIVELQKLINEHRAEVDKKIKLKRYSKFAGDCLTPTK